jgi:hypothetical protein
LGQPNFVINNYKLAFFSIKKDKSIKKKGLFFYFSKKAASFLFKDLTESSFCVALQPNSWY